MRTQRDVLDSPKKQKGVAQMKKQWQNTIENATNQLE